MGAMAATSVPFPRADACPPLYRPRNPSLGSLYQLLESHNETVKSVWEERIVNFKPLRRPRAGILRHWKLC